MKEHVLRLTKGADLKKSILKFAQDNSIEAGVVLSSVGSLTQCVIRNAGATEIIKLYGPLEIISLNGTISKNRIHLHISVANSDLNVFGGHLQDDSLIDTTVELVILELLTYKFDKQYDFNTGYYELLPKKL